MKLFTFLLLILLSHLSLGQRFQQFVPTSINLRSKGGFLIAHRANMAHLPQKNCVAFELELTQQDVSNSAWNKMFKGAYRGISLQYHDFGNKEVLGKGFSIFPHTTFPLYQGKKFGALDFRIGTGLSIETKAYDEVTNPKNNAIGSHLNGYVNLMFQYNKYFEHWHLGAGFEFSHYSNAAMKVPNLGLNIPSVVFNVGYDIKTREVFKKGWSDSLDDSNYEKRMEDELRIFVIGSSKQNPVKYTPVKSRPVIAVQGLYSLNVGSRWKVDFALDGIFNGGNQYHLDTVAYKVGETIQFGAFVGASIHFYRAEFFTGLGVYFWSPVHPFDYIYNRLGFRYHFTDKISAIVGIKAHLGIADYLEFGIGYQLWSKRRK
ncbi:acyloxyacyl hydrolase [Paracrocinitomix mangrovi]|uniref:acyloxyacyl hydrolase n=1 Tax=Paracrocinitomix mangrovi TaxID=2862509 RepID=UPI001C8EF820|nr:acyloxyacyl hydrolase [Paracrocinitomix mangrovi]UKN01670.1 acyloxyacyl hydrolase [Paracrocinitomix mangrovi]